MLLCPDAECQLLFAEDDPDGAGTGYSPDTAGTHHVGEDSTGQTDHVPHEEGEDDLREEVGRV